MSDVVTKEEYIMEGVETMIINQMPFFRKFLILKVFRGWKIKMLSNLFKRNRQTLSENLLIARPMFSSKFTKSILPKLNQIRFLEFVEAKA